MTLAAEKKRGRGVNGKKAPKPAPEPVAEPTTGPEASDVPTESKAKRRRKPPASEDDGFIPLGEDPGPAPGTPPVAHSVPDWPWALTIVEMAQVMDPVGSSTPVPSTPMPSFELVMQQNIVRMADIADTVAAMGGSVAAIKRTCDSFRAGLGEHALRFIVAACLMVWRDESTLSDDIDYPADVAAWVAANAVKPRMLTTDEMTAFIGAGDCDVLDNPPPIQLCQVMGNPVTVPLGQLVFKCACSMIVDAWDD